MGSYNRGRSVGRAVGRMEQGESQVREGKRGDEGRDGREACGDIRAP